MTELLNLEKENKVKLEVVGMKTSQFNRNISISKNGIFSIKENCDGLWSSNRGIHIECGSPYVIDTLLTSMQCLNKSCPCRISEQLYRFAQENGITELTRDIIVEFIKEWGIENPLDIFKYKFEDDGVLVSSLDEEESKEISRKLSADFGLDTIANVILCTRNKTMLSKFMEGFESFTGMYAYLDKQGLLGVFQKVCGVDLDKNTTDLYEVIMKYEDNDRLKEVCQLVSEENSEALYETLKNSGKSVLKDAFINSIDHIELAVVSLYKDLVRNRELLLESEDD